ncbi:MAG: hypothetical protein A4E42_00485 [Methanoregulaceae archaeon PtaU1.Bin222]|nr:MAG: hypothetical protein A4E42_00485 [Methanoregulaceae archaeon PtaU1.Bin222]
MPEEWIPDALIEQKMGQTKREMMEYIEKNSEKIDSNLPIFFGHVVSIIEKSFPDIPDQDYDRFIDDVTVKVLEDSKRSTDIEYIEKLFRHATRVKRKYTGRAIFDIVLGIKLIDIGKYNDAIDVLKKYRTVDAMVCTAIAFCYYELSSLELPPDKKPDKTTTSAMALNSREQMIELVRLRPPREPDQVPTGGPGAAGEQDILVHDQARHRLVPERTGISQNWSREGQEGWQPGYEGRAPENCL